MIRAATLLVCCGLCAAPVLAAPRDDLLAADRSFARLSASRGWSYAVLALAANDARLTGPGGENVAGRAQALRTLAHPQPGTLNWLPQAAFVSADGRMGWTEGRWLRSAKTARTGGGYLSVWIRERNGAWKIQASISAADPMAKK